MNPVASVNVEGQGNSLPNKNVILLRLSSVDLPCCNRILANRRHDAANNEDLNLPKSIYMAAASDK